jgi:hypothetical protein
MQLGTVAILTILTGLCTACLITNCPKGGKRAVPHSQEAHAIKQVFAVTVYCFYDALLLTSEFWNPIF